MSAVLSLHRGLFFAGLVVTLVIAGWGLLSYFRRRPPGGSFNSALVITEALFIIQGIAGGTLFLGASAARSAALAVRDPPRHRASDRRNLHDRPGRATPVAGLWHCGPLHGRALDPRLDDLIAKRKGAPLREPLSLPLSSGSSESTYGPPSWWPSSWSPCVTSLSRERRTAAHHRRALIGHNAPSKTNLQISSQKRRSWSMAVNAFARMPRRRRCMASSSSKPSTV